MTDYLDYAISLPYGSRLYGTNTDESDLDVLVLFCESEADMIARREPKPEGDESGAWPNLTVDAKYMPISRFITLLAKGDPHWSIIAMQYVPMQYFTDLLVSAHTVERMIAFAHAQAKSDVPKERAHGFRTALAAFDLFTQGEVRYPLNESEVESYLAIRDGIWHGASQIHGLTEILTSLKISGSLRETPHEDLAAEAVIQLYNQVWDRRREQR